MCGEHCSLCNKLDEPQLLVGRYRGFSSSSILLFKETCLSRWIPDSGLQLAGFQLFRVDHDTELSGKVKGGGICFYINSGWCIALVSCSGIIFHQLQTLLPVPCKFASIIPVVLTFHHRPVQDSKHALIDKILCVEQTYLDSSVSVLCDFSKGHLNHKRSNTVTLNILLSLVGNVINCQEPFSHADTALSSQLWFTNSPTLFVHTERSVST